MLLANPTVYPLWEEEIPNSKPCGLAERPDLFEGIELIRNVQQPTIEIRRPARSTRNRPAVIICPGGGYECLAYHWEGVDIASLLNAHGITALILKYRLPCSLSQHDPCITPFLDMEQAMRMTKCNAESWGINPNRIGVMGFSAGGHLAAHISTRFSEGDVDSAVPIERSSSRPDFSILAYPVISMQEGYTHGGSKSNLLGESPSEQLIEYYSNELHVSPSAPPTFLVHASDDKIVPVENSLAYYDALAKANVPSEMHLYPFGGHGFSTALEKGRLAAWTAACIDWIHEQGSEANV